MNRRGSSTERRGSLRRHPCNPSFCSYWVKGPQRAIHCRGRIADEAEAKSKEAAPSASDDKRKTSPNDNSDYSFLSDFTFLPLILLHADPEATQHMSDKRSLFKNFMPVKSNTWFVNGKEAPVFKY